MSVEVLTNPIPLSQPLSSTPDSGAPLSPSILPEFAILPHPLPAENLVVGQLVSNASELNPTALEDRDYDDIGSRWYKDVVLIDSKSGRFTESLGGVMYLNKALDDGMEIGTIEAREMRVRLLKDDSAALKKVLKDGKTQAWVRERVKSGEVGFVTAARQVTNASYKRAMLVDRGSNSWEIVREVGGEGVGGKRRDSGLDVDTGSKIDVVGVVVRKLVVKSGEITLGEEMGTQFCK